MGADTKYKGLREAIVFNETKLGTSEYKTADQIASEFGCSRAYVYRVRYLLGFKIPSLKLKDPPPSDPSTKVSKSGSLEDLLNEPLLSSLDRLKILSRLMRTGAPAVKIAAIKAYEDLTKASDSGIGPGPPLTDDDKVARIAKLLIAVPPEVAGRAWEVAFGVKAQTAASRTAVQPLEAEVPEAPTAVQEPLYDLPIPAVHKPFSRGGSQPPDGQS